MSTNKILSCKIEIEILSDLCCATGEGNGIDIDACAIFDRYGLPVIPAKRLKGLLRERGQFLVDNCGNSDSVYNQDTLNSLFGTIGGREGKIRINDAELTNADEIKRSIDNIEDTYKEYLSRDAVISLYQNVRTQTAVEKNGIARKASLRNIQTVGRFNDDSRFVSKVKVFDCISQEQKLLEDCVKILRRIGLNRNRGFGSVKCNFTTEKEENLTLQPNDIQNKKIRKRYYIETLDDIVISYGANIMPDYFSGSLIWGAIAKVISNNDLFENTVLKNVHFGNAYISDKDKIYYPIPMSMKIVKNHRNEIYNFVDRYVKNEESQYTPYNGYYCIKNGEFTDKSVIGEMEFHYTTGARVAERNLFSYKKILKGQSFSGYVTADVAVFDLLENILNYNNHCIRLGGSATAQYSRCKFEIKDESPIENIKISDEVVVELLSDAIIINKYGNNICDVSALKDVIWRNIFSDTDIEKDKIDIQDIYTKYITIGGFNNQWKLPKKQYTAYSKGSGIVLKTGNQKIEISSEGYIGIMNNEGFGHYRIRNISEQNSYKITKPEEALRDIDKTVEFAELCDESKTLVKNVLKSHIIDKVKVRAVEYANDSIDYFHMSESAFRRIFTVYNMVKKNINCNFAEKFKTEAELHFNSNRDLNDIVSGLVKNFGEIQIDTPMHDEIKAQYNDDLFEEYILAFTSQAKRNYKKIDIENDEERL